MQLSPSWRNNVLVASLSGEIDSFDSEGLGDALDQVAQADAAGIVLDFSKVSYIASMGIGMLAKLGKDVAARGIHVRIAAVRPAIRNVLEAVRLDSHFPIDGSLDESLVALAPARAR